MKLNVKKTACIALSFSMFASLAACSNMSEDKLEKEDLNSKLVETEAKKTESMETKLTETEESIIYETTGAKRIRKGEYVFFGHYEQDGDKNNGPEPIEWEILWEENGRILLVSKYLLDAKPYNTEDEKVTWETCSLRAWLNNDFINTAFDASERAQILTVTNTNLDNAYNGREGGNDTEDKVFCLSVDEILEIYKFDEWDESSQRGYSQEARAKSTQYARNNGAHAEWNGWWLRTPGYNARRESYVGYDGAAGWRYNCDDNLGTVGVRPAIYLSVD